MIIPLREFLSSHHPESFPQPWSWQQEQHWLWEHDKEKMTDLFYDITTHGIIIPVHVGPDARIWDGHHRICIAIKLGLHDIPVWFQK